jgi:hypothetical protein
MKNKQTFKFIIVIYALIYNFSIFSAEEKEANELITVNGYYLYLNIKDRIVHKSELSSQEYKELVELNKNFENEQFFIPITAFDTFSTYDLRPCGGFICEYPQDQSKFLTRHQFPNFLPFSLFLNNINEKNEYKKEDEKISIQLNNLIISYRDKDNEKKQKKINVIFNLILKQNNKMSQKVNKTTMNFEDAIEKINDNYVNYLQTSKSYLNQNKVFGYELFTPNFDRIIHKNEMNPNDLAKLYNLNPNFQLEDLFLEIQVTDARNIPFDENDLEILSSRPATYDLYLCGGYIGQKFLKRNQFPQYLPLKLFINDENIFREDNEHIEIELQNLELKDGEKINLIFNLKINQHHKYVVDNLNQDLEFGELLEYKYKKYKDYLQDIVREPLNNLNNFRSAPAA